MDVLSKDIILTRIVPHLPFLTPGRAGRALPVEVVEGYSLQAQNGLPVALAAG